MAIHHTRFTIQVSNAEPIARSFASVQDAIKFAAAETPDDESAWVFNEENTVVCSVNRSLSEARHWGLVVADDAVEV